MLGVGLAVHLPGEVALARDHQVHAASAPHEAQFRLVVGGADRLGADGPPSLQGEAVRAQRGRGRVVARPGGVGLRPREACCTFVAQVGLGRAVKGHSFDAVVGEERVGQRVALVGQEPADQ